MPIYIDFVTDPYAAPGSKTAMLFFLQRLSVPDFASAGRVNETLAAIGNLAAGGRPVLRLDSRYLLEIVIEKAHCGFLVPAHIWTPWFSLFCSRSGFDSIEDCFDCRRRLNFIRKRNIIMTIIASVAFVVTPIKAGSRTVCVSYLHSPPDHRSPLQSS